MTSAVAGRVSQLIALATRATSGRVRESTAGGYLVVSPPEAFAGRAGALAAEVPYAVTTPIPRESTVAGYVVYSTAIPAANRSLAWTFTLDGHVFYCLDLGEQGTFVYDQTTQEWAEFQTQGNASWNMHNGTMWNNQGVPRVVAGDANGSNVWELDPTALFDEGFRDIEHACSGGIVLRSRVFIAMASLRVACSSGILDDTTGAALMQLNYSDDGGQTYQGPFTVNLQTGSSPDGQQDVKFDSLGSFMAPGRVIQISDVGGVVRIDGVDAELDNYDDDTEEGSPTGVIEEK